MSDQQKVAAAERKQVEAWQRWDANPSDANMAAWDRSVAEMRRVQDWAADRADRWEASEADRDHQANWWDAARSNAQVSM